MRRNQDLAREFGTWYEGFILTGLKMIIGGQTARGYFREAGFDVPDDYRDEDYEIVRREAQRE